LGDHGVVNRPVHSLVAKPDRLRDKSPPSAVLAAHNTQRIAMSAQATPAPFDPRPATDRSGRTVLRASAFGLIAAALLAVLLAGPALAQNDPLVARVNGVEIHESDLVMAEEDVGQNQHMQSLNPEAKRDYLVSYLTDVIVAAKAAEGKKIADQKEFKSRMAFIRNKLLMETLLQEIGKAAQTPEAMKKVYEEAVKQMGAEQEVRARHILVPTEDEAKAVLAELKKGTDFGELAKQKSKDPGAAVEGGDLGYFGKTQMVPEFADAAFKLEKGQVSDPVKTQFGWHIIKVEDKRNKPIPEFDKVKDQIETYVMRKAQSEYVQKLQETAKIERLDKK
jgi:peptidyl-prolyl cis-trans isomerase C